jgi:hypothetical protein
MILNWLFWAACALGFLSVVGSFRCAYKHMFDRSILAEICSVLWFILAELIARAE